MNRIKDLDVGVAAGELGEGSADVFEALAEALPAMPGHQDEPARRIQEGEALRDPVRELGVTAQLLTGQQERVDHRVAGDVDLLGRDPFGQERPPRPLGRREMQVGHDRGDLAVRLLRPGSFEIPGPEPGLDVADRDAVVESGEARGQGRRRVAVDEDALRPKALEHALQAVEHAGGDAAKGLSLAHHVEIEVRPDGEVLEHRIEHRAVLGGDADLGFEARVGGEAEDHGRHLDGLRAGSEHRENTHRARAPASCARDRPAHRPGSAAPAAPRPGAPPDTSARSRAAAGTMPSRQVNRSTLARARAVIAARSASDRPRARSSPAAKAASSFGSTRMPAPSRRRKRQPLTGCRDDRPARGHVFRHLRDEPAPGDGIVDARRDQHVGEPQPVDHVGVGHETGEKHPIDDAALAGDRLVLAPARPVAHEEEAQLGMARGERREGADQVVHTLIVLEHADIGDEPLTRGLVARLELGEASRVDPGRVEEREVDIVEEDVDPLGADPLGDHGAEPLARGEDQVGRLQHHVLEQAERGAQRPPVGDHPVVDQLGHERSVQVGTDRQATGSEEAQRQGDCQALVGVRPDDVDPRPLAPERTEQPEVGPELVAPAVIAALVGIEATHPMELEPCTGLHGLALVSEEEDLEVGVFLEQRSGDVGHPDRGGFGRGPGHGREHGEPQAAARHGSSPKRSCSSPRVSRLTVRSRNRRANAFQLPSTIGSAMPRVGSCK
jgi:hypothetical protein